MSDHPPISTPLIDRLHAFRISLFEVARETVGKPEGFFVRYVASENAKIAKAHISTLEEAIAVLESHKHPTPDLVQAVPYDKQHPELRGLPPEQRREISGVDIPTLQRTVTAAIWKAIEETELQIKGNASFYAGVMLHSIKDHLRTTKPVSVSLTGCFNAMLMGKDDDWASGRIPLKPVRAILDYLKTQGVQFDVKD